MPFPIIAEIYTFCAVVGALVLAVSAMLGGMGQGHSAHAGHSIGGHGAGHGIGGHGAGNAAGHAIGHGAGHTGAHTGGHTGAHTGGHAGAHTGGHTGAHTGAHAGAHGSAGGTTGHSGSATNEPNTTGIVPATSRLPAVGRDTDQQLLKFVTLVNPTTISSFGLWFGAVGLFAWRLLPLPIEFTLPIALLAGLVGTKFTMWLMGMLVSKLYASGTFTGQSIIGSKAEVTVAVENGKLGEVTCIAGGSRLTSSARAVDAAQSFKRGAAVIIADVRDDVAYVEPWTESDV